jgi:hypothetical protein
MNNRVSVHAGLPEKPKKYAIIVKWHKFCLIKKTGEKILQCIVRRKQHSAPVCSALVIWAGAR